ncbi:MAG: DUF1853 family protein, partial [Deltaproteobacteria bacterium]|nr:DUF1853 family protein [Deltaproteobacteria bacterium]
MSDRAYAEDLDWALASPSLLSGERIVTDEQCRALFARARPTDPADLAAYVREHLKSPRLGIYFEVLVRYWLERKLGMRDVRSNVPIRDPRGATLGELDFLFVD